MEQNLPETTDEKLIQQYLKGDEKSLEVLVQRHLKPVYHFIYRYVGKEQDAEDIEQETFARAWRNLKKFDQQKKFKTWLFAIAKNACVDFLRKKKAIPFSEFENKQGENYLVETLADTNPLPEEIFEKANNAKILDEAIGKLPPEYRMVLFLHYNDHLKFQEIADSLEESINTIKSRHRRGLAKLKKILPKFFD